MLFACVCLCLFLSSEAQCFSSVQPASSAPEWLKTRKVRVKQSTDLKRAEGNVRLAVGEVLTLHDTSDPFWFLCSKAGGTIRGYVESQHLDRASSSIDPFYGKYLDANGVAVLSSSAVSDRALQKAGYIANMMLRKRPDIKRRNREDRIRVAIIGKNERTTQIPEYQGVNARFDARARGLGATIERPATSAGEENLLCLPSWSQDRYFGQNILVHEFAHSMMDVFNPSPGAKVRLYPGSSETLPDAVQRAYSSAMRTALWSGTYAATDHKEYFATGAAIWHEVVPQRAAPHFNHIRTRAQLMDYDRPLYIILKHVFCDDSWKGLSTMCSSSDSSCNFNSCGPEGGSAPIAAAPRDAPLQHARPAPVSSSSWRDSARRTPSRPSSSSRRVFAVESSPASVPFSAGTEVNLSRPTRNAPAADGPVDVKAPVRRQPVRETRKTKKRVPSNLKSRIPGSSRSSTRGRGRSSSTRGRRRSSSTRGRRRSRGSTF